MARLIYVEGSPRKARSHSIEVARALLEAYGDANPQDEIETLDLWALDLPEFDGDTINAKYRIMSGQEHTADEAAAWRGVVTTFERFAAGDKYVFSVPMWNFGVPYKVKQFIDVITQPGLAFTVEPGVGYKGLVADRPAVVIYSRGGAYGSDSGPEQGDFQKSYFESFLRFIGFEDIRNIVVEPTQAGPKHAQAGKDSALEQAREVGAGL